MKTNLKKIYLIVCKFWRYFLYSLLELFYHIFNRFYMPELSVHRRQIYIKFVKNITLDLKFGFFINKLRRQWQTLRQFFYNKYFAIIKTIHLSSQRMLVTLIKILVASRYLSYTKSLKKYLTYLKHVKSWYLLLQIT